MGDRKNNRLSFSLIKISVLVVVEKQSNTVCYQQSDGAIDFDPDEGTGETILENRRGVYPEIPAMLMEGIMCGVRKITFEWEYRDTRGSSGRKQCGTASPKGYRVFQIMWQRDLLVLQLRLSGSRRLYLLFRRHCLH